MINHDDVRQFLFALQKKEIKDQSLLEANGEKMFMKKKKNRLTTTPTFAVVCCWVNAGQV